MGQLLTLDDLQRQFDLVREKLSLERKEILSVAPLPADFSHDTYGFSYLRAERVAMTVLMERLQEISWLPVRLDPKTEVVLPNTGVIKKWLSSDSKEQPSSANFGNDFIHALTRVAMTNGWQSLEFRATTLRISELFHDLSCLIGLIYYGVWMAENGIGGVLVSNTYDLEKMVRDLFNLSLSPEVTQILAERNQLIQDQSNGKKRSRPNLHVIENPNWEGDDTPPPN